MAVPQHRAGFGRFCVLCQLLPEIAAGRPSPGAVQSNDSEQSAPIPRSPKYHTLDISGWIVSRYSGGVSED